MAETNDPTGGVADSFASATSKLGETKSGLKVDVTEVKKLQEEFDTLKKRIDSVTDSIKKMGDASKAATGEGSGSSYLPNPGSTTQGAPNNQGGFLGAFGAMGKGSGPLGRMGAAFGIMSLAGGFGGMGGGLTARIDRGREYASSADKLNVLTQQMYGMTQRQSMQMREPLKEFRIGQGGINAVHNFQLQTGVDARMMAAQSQGIMASSGYTIPIQDILSAQQTMMQPEVANRMFMYGMSPYKLGGGVKGPMEMMQQTVQVMGLTDERILKGALRPGSVTRSQMTMRGIPEELQTQYIQYAMQNKEFQNRGGTGMYDPTREADRRLMGIEENFATQQQETIRLREAREEQFASRQLDNMATAERQQQTIIRILGNIEDLMSKAVGVGVSNQGVAKPLGNAAQTAGGALLTGGMLAQAIPGIGTAAGGAMILGGLALTTIGSFASGDGTESPTSNSVSAAASVASSSAVNDDKITIPVGYGGKKATLNEVKQRNDFKKMHPNMQQRMLAMFRANPNLGIGGGWRDSKVQEQMFLQRYRPTTEDTGVRWNGKNWKRVTGAPAAPPGRSMHEIGLAADLIGDLDWLQANAARFGLKTFANVNNEPWHIQPAELPNSRRDYEAAGASWGTNGAFEEDAEFTEIGGKDGGTVTGGSSGTGEYDVHVGYRGLAGLNGLSISEIIAAVSAGGMASLGTGSPFTGLNRMQGGSGGGTGTPTLSPVRGNGGVLSGEDVARLAYAAGFRGQDLIDVVAIAKRESNYDPGVLNPNAATKDYSLGLMQINMLGDLGPARRALFGISSNDELYDPLTNMQAAFKLYQQSGNTLHPWGPYKGLPATYSTNVEEARSYVQAAGLLDRGGDPTERPTASGGGHSRTTVVQSSPQITVAPTINFNGTPTTPDLERLAASLVNMVREGLSNMDMRTA